MLMTTPARLLDRRAFLGGATLSAGGTFIAGLLPASLLAATPVACLVDASMYPDVCGDWQLDDICIAYPPYALALGAARPASVQSAAIADVDRHWIT
jgi:hypothetical protein